MAVCESQLESGLARLNREGSDETSQERALPAALPLTVDYRSPVSHFVPPAVELYAARHKQDQVSSASSSETATPAKRKRGRPRVDKTSPEYLANLAARKQAREMAAMSRAADTPPGAKRKRGRPRVDKTSPEYLARKRQRELEALERKAKREYKRRSTAAIPVTKTKPNATANKPQISANNKPLLNNRQPSLANNRNMTNKNSAINKNATGNKNLTNRPQRPQPRVPKRLPPVKNKIAARKLPQKTGKAAPVRKIAAKNVVVRRNTKFSKVKRKDSGASSSTGDTTPRVKRKYTKRTPSAKKNDGMVSGERAKGKRGRPRKVDPNNAQQPKIRVRNNLMPINNEPISLDSDDEPDLGSPSAASDSLSLDENLRALRHIHEKYANIDKEELFDSHLLAAKFKKPTREQRQQDDDVLSVRSSEGGASVKDLDTRVEKLEDSSNSDSDSSSSGSGSSSSGSSSSSSSCSSDSSDSSDSESEAEGQNDQNHDNHVDQNSTYGAPAWAADPAPLVPSDSGSDSDPERAAPPPAPHGGPGGGGAGSHDEISESENESPDKSFQCHICRKWYSTRVTLKIHRRSHQNRGTGSTRSRQRSSDRYECDICNETFPRREKLLAHRAEAHRGAMTFRCSVCRRCFERDDDLHNHHKAHTDDERNGRCSECGATFSRFEQLRRHRNVAHPSPSAEGSTPGGGGLGGNSGGEGGNMPHACAHCGKRFSHVHSLTRHLHNHAKQLYRCVVCKASFARADQLAQHLNSHLANYKRLKP